METTKALTNEERKAKALAYSRFMIENKKYSQDETENMLKDPHSKLRQHLDEFQRLNNIYAL